MDDVEQRARCDSRDRTRRDRDGRRTARRARRRTKRPQAAPAAGTLRRAAGSRRCAPSSGRSTRGGSFHRACCFKSRGELSHTTSYENLNLCISVSPWPVFVATCTLRLVTGCCVRGSDQQADGRRGESGDEQPQRRNSPASRTDTAAGFAWRHRADLRLRREPCPERAEQQQPADRQHNARSHRGASQPSGEDCHRCNPSDHRAPDEQSQPTKLSVDRLTPKLGLKRRRGSPALLFELRAFQSPAARDPGRTPLSARRRPRWSAAPRLAGEPLPWAIAAEPAPRLRRRRRRAAP